MSADDASGGPSSETSLARLSPQQSGLIKDAIKQLAEAQAREAELNTQIRLKELDVYEKTHRVDLEFKDKQHSRQHKRLLWTLIGPFTLLFAGGCIAFATGHDALGQMLISSSVAYLGGAGATNAAQKQDRREEEERSGSTTSP